MREEVINEKRRMKKRWDEWNRNPNGPPPPDPNIIDWRYYNDMLDLEHNYDKTFLICGIWTIGVIIVLSLLFF